MNQWENLSLETKKRKPLFESGEPWKIILNFVLTGNSKGLASGYQCLLNAPNKWIITENNSAKLQNQDASAKQNSPHN